MRPSKHLLVAKTLLVLCPLLLSAGAVNAHAQAILERLPLSVLVNHLERIPQCHLYYGCRLPGMIRLNPNPRKKSGSTPPAPKSATPRNLMR